MSDTVVISVRVPSELAAKVDQLAKDLDRPRNFIAVRALEEFVASESEWLDSVKEGIAEADASRTLPHEIVRPWLEALASGESGLGLASEGESRLGGSCVAPDREAARIHREG
jgi:predicted transcriptional regulator